MKTLAKQMIIERANKFYSRAKKTMESYKNGNIDIEFVFEREMRYRNQFKGYLQSMEDLELITEREYEDYLDVFFTDVSEIMKDVNLKRFGA